MGCHEQDSKIRRPRSVCRVCFRGSQAHDAAVVGPVVWYPASTRGGTYPEADPDDRVWSIFVSASHDSDAGPQFHIDHVIFGLAVDEVPDWALSACDAVRIIRCTDDITYDEEIEKRQQTVAKLATRFADVVAFDDEREFARFCVERWRGAKTTEILMDFERELHGT